ncbi:discoidin domain-containing protein [Sutcliffiella sp. NPDC057660]|uniref:discoidin domain-containing protein n=1 Tax=Sutcliffiella sp. NPDC057660 TaxID=3346199 RepID=UPI0036CFF501
MKKIFIVVVSLLLVLTTFIQPKDRTAKAAAEDLIVNGGFEEVTTASGWKDNVAPVGTSKYTFSGGPIYSVDTGESHTGSNSVKIESETAARGAVIQQTTDFQIGETYLLSGWIKTEDVTKALVRFQINRSGASNTLVNIKEVTGTSDWTYFERVITVPEASTLIKVESFLENSTGKVWFDDYSIRKVVELEQLNLTPSTVSMNQGDTQQLELTYFPENTSQRMVTWTSSNEEVVTVTADGLVSAVGDGYSFVQAASIDGNITSTAAISVGAAESLTVDDFSGTSQEGILEGQLSATDSNGSAITYSLAVEPKHGVVNVRQDGTFSYYPDDQYSGEDRFIFMASIENGGPKFGTATITTDGGYSTPDLDLLWYSTPKNTTLENQLQKVIYPNPDELVWAKAGEPENGQLELQTDGTFRYTPSENYVGFDHFEVSVENPSGEVVKDKVTVFVLPDTGDFISQFNENNESGSHPRLLADNQRFEEIRSMVETDRYMKEWFGLLKDAADSVLQTKPIAYDGGSSYGIIRDRLINTALMYRISGEEKYAQRAVEELDAISAYKDWYGKTNNMIPLSELTFSVALAYDWLHNYMTEEQKEKFATAIREKSLSVGLEWYQDKFRHNGEYNNINLVNNGGFPLAALAIMDKDEESQEMAAQVLRGAYYKLQQTLRFYQEDGSWLEGPAYWHYGGQYLTYMMASMNNVLGEDYGLSQLDGVKNSGEFPVHLLGEGGFFNFYDGGISMAQPESMWFADFYDRPDNAWHLGDLYDRKGVYDPLYLVFYKDGMFDQQPVKLDRTFDGIEGISMRSAWNDPNALFVSMKGFNDTLLSHHDLDAGSFVFDGLGTRWAMDLGNESYSLPGFWDYKNTRWSYYRKTAEGHNTLVVNPKENPIMQQQHDAKAMLINSESKPQGSFGILDLTERHPNDAVSMKRGMMLSNQRREVILQDEMKFMKPSELYWFMHTQADIEIIEDGKAAILSQEDKKLYVMMLNAPELAVFSEMNAEPLPTSPNPDGQTPNHGVRKLAVHMTDIEEATLSIWMVPLWEGEELPDAPSFAPLTQWQIPDGDLIPKPTRPEVTDLKVNGTTIPGFHPDNTYYELIVPFDVEDVPLVEADSDYDVTVIPAENLPGRTIVEVVDPADPDRKNRYTILFEKGPIEGELPAVNKLPVVDITASAVPEAAQGNTPDKTVDGDLNTRWAASGEQWIQYNLGAEKEVGAVSIAYMNGHQRNYFFNIQASMDGENWTEVYKGQSSGNTIKPEVFPFETVTARYIRINGSGNTSNNWNSLTEVGIFKPAPIYMKVDNPESIKLKKNTKLNVSWVYFDGNEVKAEDLIISSSDSSIIEVKKNGKLKGLRVGKATITVTDKRFGYEKTFEVLVEKPGKGKGESE